MLTEPGARHVLRRLGRLFLYGLYLLLIVVFVDYAFYLRYRYATAQPPPRARFVKAVRHVSSETLRRLGWLETRPGSSFVNFEPAKGPDVVRVGCVGDSFTYGIEVGPREDYPSILQSLFRERGYPRVEVLNFSSGWYGFQQAYILWEEVAQRFALDYVVLGPKTFFPERDTTFDHSAPATIYFQHARWVLDGNGVRLLDAVGDDFTARSAAYRRFIPLWRYLRYDARPPAFLACLLPRGRSVRNPFYYRSDIEAEAVTLYGHLIGRMARSGVQVVLGSYSPPVTRAAARARGGALCAADLAQVFGFPYTAPRGHNSPAGNRLVAEQHFALLTGRRQVSLPMIRVESPEPERAPPGRVPHRGLQEYDRFRLGREGGEPWRFAGMRRDPAAMEIPPDFFRTRGMESLLILKGPERSLPDAVFYPVSVPLSEGMPLTVRPANGPRAGQEVVLGRISLLRPGLNVGVVDLDGAFRADHLEFKGTSEAMAEFVRRPFRDCFPGGVYLGPLRILNATGPDGMGRVNLGPRLHKFWKLYPPAQLLADVRGHSEGRIIMQLEGREGRVILPLGRWRRTRRDLVVRFPPGGGIRPIRPAR